MKSAKWIHTRSRGIACPLARRRCGFSRRPVRRRNCCGFSLPAVELVRAAVANEVAAGNDDSTKHMFRSRKQSPQGSQTRLYVETRTAMAGMTIAYNDHPTHPGTNAERGRAPR